MWRGCSMHLSGAHGSLIMWGAGRGQPTPTPSFPDALPTRADGSAVVGADGGGGGVSFPALLSGASGHTSLVSAIPCGTFLHVVIVSYF